MSYNELITECRKKLQNMRADLINRLRSPRSVLNVQEKWKGDEADQTVAQQQEDEFLIVQERVRRQLLEIDAALGRMENGNFGVCEETQEPIEANRLLAIPFTRFSIEGAEIRESLHKQSRNSFSRI
jgi:DnaK suppressor protein